MEIIRRIVSTGKGIKFYKPNPVFFAVHSTANPSATAQNHVNYWRNNPRKAVHMVSDWKQAFQCVEFDYICNQVGNGNPYCIGLEICEATNRSDFERGLEIARDVILQILNRYGWTIDKNVRSHKWFTETYGGSDHIDPIPYLQRWGWTWDKFIEFLKDGDDMPSAKEVAEAVWNFEQNGVKTRDRLQGCDEAANLARDYSRTAAEAITDTNDPTGRTSGITMEDHLRYMAEKQDKMLKLLEKIAEK